MNKITTNKYNIISDIAGRYDELIDLLAIMPPCDKIILVGDLIDRGPKSKEVVELAMSMPNAITVKGNHELMMVEAAEGNTMDHLYNGGKATLKSYGITNAYKYPKSHIDWMRNLLLKFEAPGLLVTHAPYKPDLNEFDTVWNREEPEEIEGVFQIYGHNSNMTKHGDWGMCIDACFDKVLTGITFPNKEIFQVPYRD